jgi:hypothetical protein
VPADQPGAEPDEAFDLSFFRSGSTCTSRCTGAPPAGSTNDWFNGGPAAGEWFADVCGKVATWYI